MFILLVTWFYAGQPPQSYQVRFSTERSCLDARDHVLAEGRRLANPTAQRLPGGGEIIPFAPTVSAVCARA